MKVFGEFEFDERSLQLRRGGSTVPINGQCLDLLVMMLERAGQLITREEIRQALWPDSNVDFEHSLDVLVNRLRIALSDDRKNARYIQTVPKQGYKFVEQVRSDSDRYELSNSAGWIRTFGRYAAVAVLAALIALLFAHTRYQKFIPHQGTPAPTMSVLLLSGIPRITHAQTPAVVQKEGIYFVAYRTQSHIKYSSPDVFHTVASDLIAYLKSSDVNIIEDPERGILQTDESFSTESLLNLTKNAGASSLLLVTVDRPATKWLKVTVEAYDLTGKNLWTEEASSGGGMTGGGAPAKVLKTLKKKLGPRVGKPGLPKSQPGSAAQRGAGSFQPAIVPSRRFGDNG